MLRRGFPAVLAAVLIMVAVVCAAVVAWHYEQERADDERQAHADAATAAMRFQLGAVVVSLQDMRGLLESSGGEVSAARFERFTALSMRSQGSLISAWLPRVTADERAAFEGRSGIEIREQGGGGRVRPAGTRPEYFPVALAEPSTLALPLIGVDVAPALPGDSLQRARDTGRTRMSRPLQLGQGGGTAIVLFEPVYRRAEPIPTVAERRAAFLGVAAGAYRLTSLVGSVLEGLPEGTRLEIRDDGEPIYASGARLEGAADSTLEIAGRTWTVRVSGAHGASLVLPATLLAAGALLSALVLLLFQVAAKREADAQRAAEELAAAAERHRAVVDTAADGIVTIDERGTIEWVNRATEELFGWPAAELIGQNIKMLMPESLRSQHTAGLQRYLATGEARILGSQGAEATALRRDGSTFPVHLQVTEMRLGGVRKFTGFIGDITQRVAAEEQVRALNQELEQRVVERTAQLEAANRELEAFSYSVSHDLRTPLRTVSGFSAVLMEDHAHELGPDAAHLLGRIRAGAERMGMLIDDLLGLARVSRAELSRQEVDLAAIARRVVASLQEREPERRVEVRIPDEALAVGDPRLLRVVLDNLIGNAWKFTGKEPNPVVEFGAASENGTRAFFVRDNGAGFDMAYASKLFGPFQRLHHADEFEGTGIGLATVQRIVRRHGGEIRAEGEVGAGATITFTIPDAEEGE
jgi:PAS domain S-box-containing protein